MQSLLCCCIDYHTSCLLIRLFPKILRAGMSECVCQDLAVEGGGGASRQDLGQCALARLLEEHDGAGRQRRRAAEEVGTMVHEP
jgi:hypothetical protein